MRANRLPSTPTIAVVTAAAILAVVAITHGIADADYFWHITAGHLIAQTGHVPNTDPFSFTWSGRPWTPHEWLGELVIYGLSRVVGQDGTVIAFGTASGAVILTVGAMLVRRGVSFTSMVLPLSLMVLLIAPYATVRPQVLSWLLFAVLLWLLASLASRHRSRAWLLVPLFVVWANVHGLYVVGLGVVAVYCLFTIVGRTPMSAARLTMSLAGFAALLASALTPAGPAGLLYPLRYVDAGDWGLANIVEWQSPNFHEAIHAPFLLLIALALLIGLRRVPAWMQLLSAVGIGMGLLAVRNIPIAAVLVAPVLALSLQPVVQGRRLPRMLRPPASPAARRVIESCVATVVIVAAVVIFVPAGIGVGAARRVEAHFPVAAADRLEQLQANARVLAEYGWGGYVIYRLYEHGGRVFVDGRNDMYSDQILNDYVTIRNASDGWQQLLARYDVEAILLPPGAPVTQGAATGIGWCEAYRDDVAVLLLRSCPRAS
jgi:hypothetical protein